METRLRVPVFSAPADRKRQAPQIKKAGTNNKKSVHDKESRIDRAVRGCGVYDIVEIKDADPEKERQELQKRPGIVLKPADFRKMQADFVSRCDFVVESYHTHPRERPYALVEAHRLHP
jgi:hypothetical protein